MEAKVVAAEGILLAVGLRGDHRLRAVAGMMAATGTPQQAVEAEAEAVDAELLIPLHEALYEGIAPIAHTVAVLVGKKEDLRRSGDDHAVAPHGDTVGKGKPLGKQDRRLIPAVAIGVFKTPDAATRSAVAIHAGGIIGHFHHPQPSLRVPIEGNRIEHLWLAGHELDSVTGRHADSETRLFRAPRAFLCHRG